MSVLHKVKSTHPLNDNHKLRSCLKHIASPLQRLTHIEYTNVSVYNTTIYFIYLK